MRERRCSSELFCVPKGNNEIEPCWLSVSLSSVGGPYPSRYTGRLLRMLPLFQVVCFARTMMNKTNDVFLFLKRCTRVATYKSATYHRGVYTNTISSLVPGTAWDLVRSVAQSTSRVGTLITSSASHSCWADHRKETTRLSRPRVYQNNYFIVLRRYG